MAAEITLPELVRLSGIPRKRLLRHLRNAGDVVLHERGAGKRRKHFSVAWHELMASRADWIADAIDWATLLAARRRAAPPDADDDD